MPQSAVGLYFYSERDERDTDTQTLSLRAAMKGSGGRVIKKYTIKLKISGRSRCKSKRDSHLWAPYYDIYTVDRRTMSFYVPLKK